MRELRRREREEKEGRGDPGQEERASGFREEPSAQEGGEPAGQEEGPREEADDDDRKVVGERQEKPAAVLLHRGEGAPDDVDAEAVRDQPAARRGVGREGPRQVSQGAGRRGADEEEGRPGGNTGAAPEQEERDRCRAGGNGEAHGTLRQLGEAGRGGEEEGRDEPAFPAERLVEGGHRGGDQEEEERVHGGRRALQEHQGRDR